MMTIEVASNCNFTTRMNSLKIIALTHKTAPLELIGKLHLDESKFSETLNRVKKDLAVEELMYLSTCNRVEFILSTSASINNDYLVAFIKSFKQELSEKEISEIISSVSVLENEEAIKHLNRVASSLDSLVVGEREIITQVRNAYELCRNENLTGDLIRLAIQKTIECAKRVYTETNIAKNPVSVMSLAYRKLRDLNVKLDAKFLIIGAGMTNTIMAKYLKKHGFTNFTVFNRTLANGERLAKQMEGKAYPLAELKNHTKGFDVIVTCTAASEPVITKEIYSSLLRSDKSKKIVVDLAVPNDLDEEVLKSYDVTLIAVNNLQEIAKKNLQEREKELSSCEKIIAESVEEFRKGFKERMVELAMSDVPKKVKEIREIAVREVFAKEIEQLDVQSKETLDKVIAYLEKKYISVPMKMAKEILIDEVSSK